MAKPLFTIAAAGVVGLVLWKMLGIILLPLIGTVLALVVMAIKVILIVGLVWLLFRLFNNRKKEGGEAHAD